MRIYTFTFDGRRNFFLSHPNAKKQTSSSLVYKQQIHINIHEYVHTMYSGKEFVLSSGKCCVFTYFISFYFYSIFVSNNFWWRWTFAIDWFLCTFSFEVHWPISFLFPLHHSNGIILEHFNFSAFSNSSESFFSLCVISSMRIGIGREG